MGRRLAHLMALLIVGALAACGPPSDNVLDGGAVGSRGEGLSPAEATRATEEKLRALDDPNPKPPAPPPPALLTGTDRRVEGTPGSFCYKTGCADTLQPQLIPDLARIALPENAELQVRYTGADAVTTASASVGPWTDDASSRSLQPRRLNGKIVRDASGTTLRLGPLRDADDQLLNVSFDFEQGSAVYHWRLNPSRGDAQASPTHPPTISPAETPPIGTPGTVEAAPPTPVPPAASRGDQRSAPRKSPVADWVHTFRFAGVSYTWQRWNDTSLLERERLGPVHDRVRYRLDGGERGPHHELRDGDATLLDKGIPVYEVERYDPRFRLAACYGGLWRLYEADSNEGAKTGADLLDIRGKVRYVGIHDFEGEGEELAVIGKLREVRRLVEIVLAAAVAQPWEPSGEYTHRIVLHLRDGTTVSRAYSLDSGELWRGIILPPEFGSAVRRALEKGR